MRELNIDMITEAITRLHEQGFDRIGDLEFTYETYDEGTLVAGRDKDGVVRLLMSPSQYEKLLKG